MTSRLEQEKVENDAIRAMLYEVSVNPKPGLVDPVRSGAHPDMDVFNFIDSALSLRPYFRKCFSSGVAFDGKDLRDLFDSIRADGIVAEKTMLAATKGLNTHKGAIFSLGILVTALGYQNQTRGLVVDELPAIVSSMLAGLLQDDFAGVQSKAPDRLTAGEKQFIKYGITGIRGQAAAGYPAVFKNGLPYLCQTTGTRNQRLLDTFMKIISCTQDSNLIKRAGNIEIVKQVQLQAVKFLKAGGSKTKAGMTLIREMDQFFTENHLSLGGSADMLILTIFLALLTENL